MQKLNAIGFILNPMANKNGLTSKLRKKKLFEKYILIS
jgi:hypothetical protein